MTVAGADPGRPDTRVDCFCLRRVNPFLGVVAVVRTAAARAISMDGHTWQLQVRAHPPRGIWSGAGYQSGWRYYRFGFWSDARGSSRVPLNPILDAGAMVEAVEVLITAIQAQAPALPFPLAKELELWLLDADEQPLALLATAMEPNLEILAEIGRPDWIAGGRGERVFVSPALQAQGIAERDPDGAAQHAMRLERLVRAAAGRRRQVQWFRRDQAGAVAVGDGAHLLDAGRALPAMTLPLLPLRPDWPAGLDADLVDDYLRWLAPYLLTLPALDDDLRRRLEQDAAADAMAVNSCWRLYPKVLDQDLIRRCRVEARLREAHV